MGREGRDYWEAQLSEYWDSGLTIQGMRPASPMVRRKRDFFEWEFTKKMNAVGRLSSSDGIHFVAIFPFEKIFPRSTITMELAGRLHLQARLSPQEIASSLHYRINKPR